MVTINKQNVKIPPKNQNRPEPQQRYYFHDIDKFTMIKLCLQLNDFTGFSIRHQNDLIRIQLMFRTNKLIWVYFCVEHGSKMLLGVDTDTFKIFSPEN